MKPLVYYCRWQGASLRLRGRDDTAVWGTLVYNAQSGEEMTQPFHFNLHTHILTLTQPDGEKTVQLDEMGVALTP